MSSKRTKQLSKIYTKIMQILTSCDDNYIEYYKYIDDVMDNNQYTLLKDVFSICFKTDLLKFNNLTKLKRESFRIAKSNIDTYFQINLKGFYDSNNVYQVGKKIYDATNNSLLGIFEEQYRMQEINYNGVTYSYYPNNIYYRDPCLFQKLDEAKAIELNVYVGNKEDDVKYVLSDVNMILLEKYKLAVSLLKNGDVKHYADVDYISKFWT